MLKTLKSFCFLFQGMLLLLFISCSKGNSGGEGLSILPDTENFSQKEGVFKKKKIDILWVIDNSISMRPYQTRLQNSFQSFINRFQSLNYDFHMAVATSDAYVNDSNTLWKTGNPIPAGSGVSGYKIITTDTPDLADAFLKNVNVGILGNADERPLQSLERALEFDDNAGFHREGSFLSIIILTDENDSSSGRRRDYTEFLNEFTQSTFIGEYYSISVIASINGTSSCSRSFAKNLLIKIAEDTNGVVVDICEANYDPHLKLISDTVIELSTLFSLKRIPVEDSIVVTVDGNKALKDETNGWSYESKQNGIFFHGTAIPEDGSSIDVGYTPASLEI